MALTLDGSSGIASVDGSAGSPSIRGSDANSGIVYTTDQVKISAGGVVNATFKSSEVLVDGTLKINDGSASANRIAVGNSGDLLVYHDGSNSYIQNTTNSIYIGGTCPVVTNGYYNYLQSSNGSNATLTLKKSAGASDGTDYLQCRNSSNHLKLVVEPDGDCKNSNGTYNQISDSKLKENIVDANSQWADIKAIKIRNWNFKASTGFDTHTQIGLVAQELETVCPKLVKESIDRDPETGEDLGTKTKSVKTSILYMKAIKALQEAITKIETLETKVAALEAG